MNIRKTRFFLLACLFPILFGGGQFPGKLLSPQTWSFTNDGLPAQSEPPLED